MAYCPECGSKVNTSANFCSECGADLDPIMHHGSSVESKESDTPKDMYELDHIKAKRVVKAAIRLIEAILVLISIMFVVGIFQQGANFFQAIMVLLFITVLLLLALFAEVVNRSWLSE